MISGGWVEVVAVAAAFAIAAVTTPAGVSGAVLLLPFQVSVLGTPSPAVTPTNLLYNIVATPGAIVRYRRQGQTGGTLTWLLLAGTLPGVVAGSIIRVYLLPGPIVFDLVIAAVLIPLGSWLALTPPTPASTARPARLPHAAVGLIAAIAGCVGGIYGIGGGSILAPILIADGLPTLAGRSRRAQLHLPHLARRHRDILHPVRSPARRRRPGLANRDRPGRRRTRRRLRRSPPASPPARDDHPAPPGPDGHRDRHPLPLGRPWLTAVTAGPSAAPGQKIHRRTELILEP